MKALAPLLSEKVAGEAHRRPQVLQAAYGAGIALYHLRDLEGCVGRLQQFLALKAR